MVCRSIYYISMCLSLVATSVLAATEKEDEFLDLLAQENQVFAASRYVQTIAETPANVSIISRDDISRFGYRTIADALSSLPGFYNAASQWPALGIRGIAVPGDFGSRVLYMVNGMPLYEPTYGGFFLEYLDIASIERIEVVRGSGSALYGSGAVMGIVNLITRNGHDAPGQAAHVEASSHNAYTLYGSAAGVLGDDLDAFSSVSVGGSKGRDIYLAEYGGTAIGNSGYENLRVFGRVSNQDFWVQALYVDGSKRDPLASYGTVFNSDKLLLRERFGTLELGINRRLSNDAILTGRVYAFDVSERGDYPYKNNPATTSDPADYINVTDIMSQTFGMELRYDQFVSANHHMLSGLEVKRVLGHYEVGNQPTTARSGLIEAQASPSYSQYSLFVQDEWRLDERRKITMGARYDTYSGFSEGVNSHISPRVAYVQDFGGGHTGKLIFGEAFRAPTIYESLYTDTTPAGGTTLWRNPNLKPEIARTLEAVWERELRQGINYSVSTYITQLRNTPKQTPLDVFEGKTCANPGTCNQYQNSQGVQEVIGVEGAAKWKRDDGLISYASVTLQKSSEQPDADSLTSSPRYLLKGGLSYPALWQRWNASIEIQVVGDTDGRLNQNGTKTTATPTYFLINASFGNVRIGNNWRASLRINNLFDRNVYTVASRELQPLERVPAPGRIFSFQIGKDF